MEILSESWRQVLGYEELYEVSDAGRVRSVDRRVTQASSDGVPYSRVMPGRVLRPVVSRTGYKHVVLSRQGKVKTAAVHVMVAAAFHGQRPARHQINHRDGDKQNNQSVNLEYVTAGDNLRHAFATGLRGTKRGRA